MARPKISAVLPYKLLVIVLYGRFKWVNRDPLGVTRLPTARLCSYLRTDTQRLREAMESLDDWGVITRWKWWGHYIEIVPEVPQGMIIKIPEIDTIEASVMPPEILELL